MQNSTNSEKKTEFFVAANGYNGFRSYFPSVFPSEAFERIFVLKGGPGTGKSSLMRAVASFARNEGLEYESILCSSDPHSLDGVIVKGCDKRFAVIDGTAPHARDAEVPGAIDEIINLGENWNEDVLSANRRLILELGKKKKENYALAYEYLSRAGAVMRMSREIQSAHIRRKNLETDIKKMAEELSSEEKRGSTEIRLVDSFGRFGQYRIGTLEAIAERTITVKDLGTVSREMMSLLYSELRDRGIGMTVFPSVFDASDTDAIYLPVSGTVIALSDAEDTSVDTEKYLINGTDGTVPEKIRALYDALLAEAKRYFTFASDMHFELEKIYIGAMDFSANAEFAEKIIEKIKKATK